MTLMYAVGGFIGGFIALREYLMRRAGSESVKAIPFLVLSLLLTLIAMCSLCGFLSQFTASIAAVSR